MRIAIDALFEARGGSWANLSQLLREWQAAGELERHEFVVFSSGWTLDRLRETFGGRLPAEAEFVRLELPDRGLPLRLASEWVDLPRRLRSAGAEVVFCPANTVPFLSAVPCVVTFQNAAPFCETITPQTVGLRWWLRFKALGAVMERSARHATRVIFISETFRSRFSGRVGLPPGKGVVIPRAANAPGLPAPERRAEVRARYGLRGRYALYVSHLYPYKSVAEVMAGFDSAWRAGPGRGVTLVVAGRVAHRRYAERLERALRTLEAGRAGAIRLLGEVAPAEVPALMADAHLFVFASTCENCPTTLIEAMTLGLPIACSDVGVMPEFGGDGVAYFDPRSVPDTGRALEALLADADLRARLGARAAARAATFPTAAEVAARTLATIEGAVDG